MRAEVIREVEVLRWCCAWLAAGDALAVEENVVFYDIAGEIGFNQRIAAGSSPVQSSGWVSGAGSGGRARRAFFYALAIAVIQIRHACSCDQAICCIHASPIPKKRPRQGTCSEDPAAPLSTTTCSKSHLQR